MSLFDLFLPSGKPEIRVYHSYGDEDRCFVMGHVLEEAPDWGSNRFRKGNLLRNAGEMLNLFRAKPQANGSIYIDFGRQKLEAAADEKGFFFIELKGDRDHLPGWNPISVTGISGSTAGVVGEGKVYHPASQQQGFISDIDDTFMVSHSVNIFKRLRVLLTKTPETRKPFEGVAAHYQALALKNASEEATNPFFYVSSSEWNLYSYIKDFCRYHRLPEGIFLLSDLKELKDFVSSGQKNHHTKFDRIQRILQEYPSTKFALLGDDTQEDPRIYHRTVQQFPEQINAVYVRKRSKTNRERTRQLLQEIGTMGVPVSYFKHSREALEHSRKIGLA